MKTYQWIGGVISLLAGIIYYYPTVLYIFLFVVYSLLLILITVAVTIYVHFWLSSAQNKSHSRALPTNVLYNATCSSIFDAPQPIANASNLPILFGRTVDGVLQQIIEYAIRDFISPWLGYVVEKPRMLSDLLREDLWNGVKKLRDRAVKIDASKVLAVDMVTRVTLHLEKIRLAKQKALDTGGPLIFSTSSYLVSEEKELEFLRKICEIMVIFLLPRGYSMPPLKNLLSELLSYKILHPMIKMVTAPDYLNQKVVQYIEGRLAAVAIHKRTYEYAACYEDFIKIISSAQCSIEELLMIRTSIVNDIVQATAMQNMQRAKGLQLDQGDNAMGGLSKADFNMAIKLKRYLQQLTYAKAQCEKSLLKLGWTTDQDLNLSLTDVMASCVGRRYFTLFLESLKANNLIGFYMSVEELRHAPKGSHHQLGAEIFYTYVRAPNAEIVADRHIRKRMEAFLLGDCGPEVFYEAQKMVLVQLEEKYFPSFVLSDQYKLLTQANALNTDAGGSTAHNNNNNNNSSSSNNNNTVQVDQVLVETPDLALDLANHSTYARSKLEQLEEKLDNKSQAWEALRSSMKPESKVLAILEKEVEWLRGEKRQLEAHLLRTEMWAENLGQWRATIQSVDMTADDKEPQFIVLVQTDENSKAHKDAVNGKVMVVAAEEENISTGWVVLRSLAQFYDLHRQLRPLCPELRNVELPSMTFKVFFLKNDKASLDRVKAQVQRYLNFILHEDNLYQSEAVYAFLSPSSEHLKQVLPSPKKAKFSLATLFFSKGSNGGSGDGFSATGGGNGGAGGFGGTSGGSSSGGGGGGGTSDMINASSGSNNTWGGTAGTRDSEEEMSQYLEAHNNPMLADDARELKQHDGADGKDSIAEPLYGLMSETFEMGGIFKWVRKSMISFVQISYGRTINRQIRESITALFEESMLHHYATTALTSFWPGGTLAGMAAERTREMQEATAHSARALLCDNVPEVFSNLVGQQTAKLGAQKIFETLQEPTYNKQLFYELIEIMMIELFPEIRQLKTPKPRPKFPATIVQSKGSSN